MTINRLVWAVVVVLLVAVAFTAGVVVTTWSMRRAANFGLGVRAGMLPRTQVVPTIPYQGMRPGVMRRNQLAPNAPNPGVMPGNRMMPRYGNPALPGKGVAPRFAPNPVVPPGVDGSMRRGNRR